MIFIDLLMNLTKPGIKTEEETRKCAKEDQEQNL
jgi:hypothetical protein